MPFLQHPLSSHLHYRTLADNHPAFAFTHRLPWQHFVAPWWLHISKTVSVDALCKSSAWNPSWYSRRARVATVHLLVQLPPALCTLSAAFIEDTPRAAAIEALAFVIALLSWAALSAGLVGGGSASAKASESATAAIDTDGELLDGTCVICFDRTPSTRLACGHAVCCTDCARRLRKSSMPRCPICRSSPVDVIDFGDHIASEPTFLAPPQPRAAILGVAVINALWALSPTLFSLPVTEWPHHLSSGWHLISSHADGYMLAGIAAAVGFQQLANAACEPSSRERTTQESSLCRDSPLIAALLHDAPLAAVLLPLAICPPSPAPLVVPVTSFLVFVVHLSSFNMASGMMNWISALSEADANAPLAVGTAARAFPSVLSCLRRDGVAAVLAACSVVATTAVLLRTQLTLGDDQPGWDALFVWTPWVLFLGTAWMRHVTWQLKAGRFSRFFAALFLAAPPLLRILCNCLFEPCASDAECTGSSWASAKIYSLQWDGVPTLSAINIVLILVFVEYDVPPSPDEGFDGDPYARTWKIALVLQATNALIPLLPNSIYGTLTSRLLRPLSLSSDPTFAVFALAVCFTMLALLAAVWLLAEEYRVLAARGARTMSDYRAARRREEAARTAAASRDREMALLSRRIARRDRENAELVGARDTLIAAEVDNEERLETMEVELRLMRSGRRVLEAQLSDALGHGGLPSGLEGVGSGGGGADGSSGGAARVLPFESVAPAPALPSSGSTRRAPLFSYVPGAGLRRNGPPRANSSSPAAPSEQPPSPWIDSSTRAQTSSSQPSNGTAAMARNGPSSPFTFGTSHAADADSSSPFTFGASPAAGGESSNPFTFRASPVAGSLGPFSFGLSPPPDTVNSASAPGLGPLPSSSLLRGRSNTSTTQPSGGIGGGTSTPSVGIDEHAFTAVTRRRSKKRVSESAERAARRAAAIAVAAGTASHTAGASFAALGHDDEDCESCPEDS